MKVLAVSLLLLAAVGCNPGKKINMKSHTLNGSWIPIKQEIAGNALPPAAFASQKLVIADSNYTFTAESVDKGVVTTTKDHMDIFGREGINKGKHFTALFKMENGQLTICYNLAGNSYPEAFETKGKPTYFLCVFKKE